MNLLITSLRTAAVITVAVLICSSLTLVIVAGDASAEEHVVEIRNLEFTPSELSVSPGDTITWINYDFVPHTVTADDKSWDSGLIKAEGQWQMVVKADMLATYFCSFHPTMKATLVIVKQ